MIGNSLFEDHLIIFGRQASEFFIFFLPFLHPNAMFWKAAIKTKFALFLKVTAI